MRGVQVWVKLLCTAATVTRHTDYCAVWQGVVPCDQGCDLGNALNKQLLQASKHILLLTHT